MENVVITIARQYGSGGKTIGKMLAEDLGIPFYDREVLQMASEDSGIHMRLFGAADEKLKRPREADRGTEGLSGKGAGAGRQGFYFR